MPRGCREVSCPGCFEPWAGTCRRVGSQAEISS